MGLTAAHGSATEEGGEDGCCVDAGKGCVDEDGPSPEPRQHAAAQRHQPACAAHERLSTLLPRMECANKCRDGCYLIFQV